MAGRCGRGHRGRLHGGGSIGVSPTGRRRFDVGSLGVGKGHSGQRWEKIKAWQGLSVHFLGPGVI